jgi:hypothetical protein
VNNCPAFLVENVKLGRALLMNTWRDIFKSQKQKLNLIMNFFFLWLYSPLTALAASHIGGFLNYIRHMAGLLGRVISPSQGLYLHRTTQHRKTRDKHLCLERDSNPLSQQPTGQGPRLRPHGHCDRRL